jgi:ElaB/YqjD/DUF883 family membrane-anchored ribosome-binding protein
MNTEILDKMVSRIQHANATKAKEIRLSLDDANELLAVIAHVSNKESEELRGMIKDFLEDLSNVKPQVINVSGGTFK